MYDDDTVEVILKTYAVQFHLFLSHLDINEIKRHSKNRIVILIDLLHTCYTRLIDSSVFIKERDQAPLF